jgi:hypothetical protein
MPSGVNRTGARPFADLSAGAAIPESDERDAVVAESADRVPVSITRPSRSAVAWTFMPQTQPYAHSPAVVRWEVILSPHNRDEPLRTTAVTQRPQRMSGPLPLKRI